MAEPATLARPYAEAVFELAQQTGTLDQWSGALSRLAALSADPSVKPLIGNPRVTEAQLVDLFVSSGGEDVSLARNFLATLADNGRLNVLPQVHELFEDLKNQREGVVEADITTAFPLDDAELAGLVGGLERRFKRKVQTSVRVDDSLIGGVRIKVGDEVIDSSVRGKLAAMSSALAAG